MLQKLNLPQPKNHELSEVISQFLSGTGWVAPGDALLRVTETLIWRNFQFKHPILEIGCGDGTISQYLYKHLDKIDMGIDLDPTGAMATSRYKATKKADATKLPFPDNSFATVISNSTFEHIGEDLQAVSEVARVLKKGGEFWVTVPTPTLKRELQTFTSSPAAFKKINDRIAHYHYRSAAEWGKHFAAVDLKLTAHQTYLSPSAIHLWYKLFRAMTFIPYKRELWSYLTDQRFHNLFPSQIIRQAEHQILLKKLSEPLIHSHGAWQMLKAVKL
jgi:ubiquinone/menaquinone biosynthesis C-methylase UbiE